MTRPKPKTHRCKMSDMYDLHSEYRSILRADLTCVYLVILLGEIRAICRDNVYSRRDIEMAIEKQEATNLPVLLRVGSKG